MNLAIVKNEDFERLIEDLEESIFNWQKLIKAEGKDKRFNARKYLADLLGYKDVRIIYRFLDPNDNSRSKMGLQDLQKIISATGDIEPLDNFVKSLKAELKDD